MTDQDRQIAAGETPAGKDDLGLSIDMLDVDRLREWARLLYISHWGSVPHVAGKLQTLATNMEKAIRDVGTLRAALAAASPPQAVDAPTWQPMETAPKDGSPFLICWASPLRPEPRVPLVEMVGGWQEYQACRSWGEPEAYGWHPLPRPLSSPMTAPGKADPHD